jgi:hypothetical protein
MVAMFDAFRAQYPTMDFDEKADVYRWINRAFPDDQDNYTLDGVLTSLRHVNPLKVVELGGYSGALAAAALAKESAIRSWVNFDLALPDTVCSDTRYSSVLLNDFFWNDPVARLSVQQANLFVCCHTLEHMLFWEVSAVLQRIKGVPFVHLELPVELSATTYDWSGRYNLHVLEVGLIQIQKVMEGMGYHMRCAGGEVGAKGRGAWMLFQEGSG